MQKNAVNANVSESFNRQLIRMDVVTRARTDKRIVS
jgi:hypothetical protein